MFEHHLKKVVCDLIEAKLHFDEMREACPHKYVLKLSSYDKNLPQKGDYICKCPSGTKRCSLSTCPYIKEL